MRLKEIIFTLAAIAVGPAFADDQSASTKVCFRLSEPKVDTCKALEAVSYFTAPSPVLEEAVGDKVIRLKCWYHYSVIGGLLPRRLVAILDVTDRKAGVHTSQMGETVTKPGACSVAIAGGRRSECCLGAGR
jgi:hypothetical protein